MRDAFPPSMCVVWIVYAFRLADCVWRLIPFGQIARGRLMSFGWIMRVGDWFRLVGLCVNGYFVRVGLRGKI